MDVSASPLWMRYSPGAQKLLRICNDSSLRQPCDADSKMGSCRISRCRCMDTSPRSSSGNSLRVWNRNCLDSNGRPDRVVTPCGRSRLQVRFPRCEQLYSILPYLRLSYPNVLRKPHVFVFLSASPYPPTISSSTPRALLSRFHNDSH